MNVFSVFSFALIFLLLLGCSSAEINKLLQSASGQAPLTQTEVSQGLKEALIQGISKGADKASMTDGFFKNELIKILLPEDARRVESTLRQVGLGSEVDRSLLAINRGAERAAQEAKPIFISAIRQMTIQDAFNILQGGEDAATQYLKRTTENQLIDLFQPKIQESLNEVGATRYYGDLANAYNSLPLTNRKIEPDLNSYVTERAVDGLFQLIAEEEKNIRENPIERTSALMRRVFGTLD
jgi:DNA-binding transcriptional ArsR family regulator